MNVVGRWSAVVGVVAGVVLHATAFSQPSRYATSVLDFEHPEGQEFGTPEQALGPPRGAVAGEGSLDVWSLGTSPNDGGAYLTLGFDGLLFNGPGPDLIVFENPFLVAEDLMLGEFAFVEVSSDDVHFARYPARSSVSGPIGPFLPFDPSGAHNLAGSAPTLANVDLNPLSPLPFDAAAAGGTAFDFDDLTTHPLVLDGTVDLDRIRAVRIVDVLGDGTYFDAFGNPIYDATGNGNAADIDAVAAIHLRDPEPADWQRPATANRHAPAAVRELGIPAWETAGEGLALQGSVTVMPGTPRRVLAWGTAGDSVFVKAFDAERGTRLWTSPPLEKGVSVDYLSMSVPCGDAARGRVYFATGRRAYALHAADGAIAWEQPLAGDAVNASMTVAGPRAFALTYGGVLQTATRLYAFDAATGAPDWDAVVGGPGSETPIVSGEIVYTLRNRGMGAYRADTGEVVWTNAAPLGEAAPWQTDLPFFGGLVLREGALLSATYDFADGSASELVAVDAATGALLWRRGNVPNSDATPLVLGDAVVLPGHRGWGSPSVLAAFALTDGTPRWSRTLATGSSMWNVSAVACEDAIYVTEGLNGYGFSANGLHILSPDGEPIAEPESTWAKRARGTPALGADGSVFTLMEGGRLARWGGGTVAEVGWMLR